MRNALQQRAIPSGVASIQVARYLGLALFFRSRIRVEARDSFLYTTSDPILSTTAAPPEQISCFFTSFGFSSKDEEKDLLPFLKIQPAMASTVKDTKSKPQYDPAPLTKHFEFMGPPGALGITIATTFFAYFFALGCSEHGCPSMPFGTFLANGFKKYTTADGLLSLWDPQAALLYTAWYTYTMLCWWLLPGEWVSGVTLRNGEALKYKMNGERASNLLPDLNVVALLS